MRYKSLCVIYGIFVPARYAVVLYAIIDELLIHVGAVQILTNTQIS